MCVSVFGVILSVFLLSFLSKSLLSSFYFFPKQPSLRDNLKFKILCNVSMFVFEVFLSLCGCAQHWYSLLHIIAMSFKLINSLSLSHANMAGPFGHVSHCWSLMLFSIYKM